MVRGRSVFRRNLLFRVITEERKRWTRLKEKADAQLTALEHAETAYAAALRREAAPERGPQDPSPQTWPTASWQASPPAVISGGSPPLAAPRAAACRRRSPAPA